MFSYHMVKPRVFSVGHYNADSEWEPESEHGTKELAAARVVWLNGGGELGRPLAHRIVDRLFTTGDGLRAQRLVLELPGGVGGGLCRGHARDVIIRAFAEQRPVEDDPLAELLDDVADELRRAEATHPPLNSAHKAYAVILEGLEEYWEQVRLKREERDSEQMRAELIRTAAMCVRAVRDLIDRPDRVAL